MQKVKSLVAALVAFAVLAMPGVAAARDRDHDRLPDRWEKRFKLSTHKKSGRADHDADGLNNLGEFRSRTSPRDLDSDDDGMEDGDEDRDRDRVDNLNEVREGTRPNDRDTDDDGRSDAREDADHDRLTNLAEDLSGNDPRDPDTDDDGTGDGDERAGTVLSYEPEAGRLVLALAGGARVEGFVTEETNFECESEDEHEDGDESEDEQRERESSDDEDPLEEEDTDPGDAPGEAGARSARASEADSDEVDGEPGESLDDEDEEDLKEIDACSEEHLVPGAAVHEAELRVTAEGTVIEEIELLR